jgi:hypothetical protein
VFCGFFDSGDDIVLAFVTRGSSNEPIDPDANPTYRVFGASGAVSGGSGSAAPLETGSVTGATNASPIVVTSASHGLATGAYVKVASVGGNTAANGSFAVTAVDANSFSLDGSTGNGSYTSGGTWKTAGLFKVTLTGSVLSSLAAGSTYTVQVNWLESSAARSLTLTFTVQ